MSEKRLQMIKEYLEHKNEITTKHFLKKEKFFNASQITLRRDLHKLEKEGYIRLSYGYIKILDDISLNKNVKTSDHISDERMSHKKKMSSIANQLLEDGDVIFVNTGTTCEEFVTQISKEVKLLITNSLTTVSRALKNKNIKDILLIGGVIDKNKKACFSNINYDFLNDIYFDKFFTSCSSVRNETEIFFDDIEEHRLITRLLPNSSFSCLFVDDYKINKTALIKSFSIDQFDELIYYNTL